MENLHFFEVLKELVDWDHFMPILEEVFSPPRTCSLELRPWDYLVIFRSLLLGVMNGLSDEQLQYMLLDRTAFKSSKRFSSSPMTDTIT